MALDDTVGLCEELVYHSGPVQEYVVIPDGPVNVNDVPTHTGPLFVAVATGNALTVTVLCGAAAEQVVAVIVSMTFTVPVPDTFHVTVIEFVPAPPVMVPPVTTHA